MDLTIPRRNGKSAPGAGMPLLFSTRLNKNSQDHNARTQPIPVPALDLKLPAQALPYLLAIYQAFSDGQMTKCAPTSPACATASEKTGGGDDNLLLGAMQQRLPRDHSGPGYWIRSFAKAPRRLLPPRRHRSSGEAAMGVYTPGRV